MAYGLEYWLPFTSYFDSSVEVCIKREADSSSETYFTADGRGTELHLMHSSRKKFEQVLFGAICTVPLMTRSKTGYDDLFTTDNREYKVQLKKDGTVFWEGYGEANEHRRGYDNPSFIRMAFVDGLGRLKDIEFNYNETFGWHTPQRLSKIIGYCLYQTGLNLPVRESVNVYEENHDNGTDKSMFYQTYQYPRAYRGLSCAEVLKRILQGSIVWQRNNKWYIVRIHELISNTITYREWLYVADMMGGDAPDNDSTENLSITLTEGAATARASMNVFIQQSKRRDMQGGWKEFTINQHFNLNSNLIKDHENDFTAVGDIEYETMDEGIRIENSDRTVWDVANYLKYDLGEWEDTINISDINRRFEISVEGTATGHFIFAFYLEKDDGTKYWLQSDGEWGDPNLQYWFYDGRTEDFLHEEEFSIEVKSRRMGVEGTLYFIIYEPFMYGSETVGNSWMPYITIMNEDFVVEISYDDKFYGSRDSTNHVEDLETLTEVSTNNSEVPNDIDFYLTDETTDNDHLVYDSMMYYLDGADYVKTKRWNRRGAENNATYLQLLIQEITWQNSEEWAILSGRLVGHFKFGDIIVDTDDKRYFIIDAVYGLRDDQWEITAFEISKIEYLAEESAGSFIITESTEEEIPI